MGSRFVLKVMCIETGCGLELVARFADLGCWLLIWFAGPMFCVWLGV